MPSSRDALLAFISSIEASRRVTRTLALLTVLAALGETIQAQTAAAPALSAAETAAIARGIATLRSPEERKLASEWSDAKKVAETLCRPAALPALKKKIAGADRVFLGTEDPKTLNLESDRQLTGTGSARTPQGWQDFAFTCNLDPTTGKATSFQAVLTPAAAKN